MLLSKNILIASLSIIKKFENHVKSHDHEVTDFYDKKIPTVYFEGEILKMYFFLESSFENVFSKEAVLKELL